MERVRKSYQAPRQNYSNDYYMYTANALAPEILPEAPVARPVRPPQVKTRPVTRQHPVQSLARNLAGIMLIFVLGVLLVGQYVYIQGLGYQVSQNKSELTVVLNANEKLKQEYAARGDLKAIETYAVYNLGMVKPEETMTYVARSVPTTVTASAEAVAENNGVVEEQGGLLATISGLLGIFNF